MPGVCETVIFWGSLRIIYGGLVFVPNPITSPSRHGTWDRHVKDTSTDRVNPNGRLVDPTRIPHVSGNWKGVLERSKNGLSPQEGFQKSDWNHELVLDIKIY